MALFADDYDVGADLSVRPYGFGKVNGGIRLSPSNFTAEPSIFKIVTEPVCDVSRWKLSNGRPR